MDISMYIVSQRYRHHPVMKYMILPAVGYNVMCLKNILNMLFKNLKLYKHIL